MAAPSRRTDACLGDLLLAEGWRCEFYQAVRLWQRAQPGRVPVGEGDVPDREAVRFRSTVSFAFPRAEIVDLRLDPDADGRAELTAAFLGVATPASFGSLPTLYAEDVATRDRDREPALHDFLDLFNHRLISLFYRAWEKNNPAVVYERLPEGETGVFAAALRALLGMGPLGVRDNVSLPDALLLGRAGLLRPGCTSAAALAEVVEQVFDVPAAVRQFVPRWFALERDDRSRLARTGTRLGVDLVLGDRVPLAQSRFRLELGPLDWATFRSLLPCGEAFSPLHELVRLAVGPDLTFDVQLDLGAAAVPPLRLDAGADAPRLGWTTWLGATPDAATTAVVVGAPAAA